MIIRDEINKFFSKTGILSNKFDNFEYRYSQIQMAYSVCDTLENRSHIFIEAPTGIGKSFAYLVPAIYYAKENKKKAIISTHTINLQEQLINKDIPFLKEHLPVSFEANLIKGKNNYICPKRLRKALNSASVLFESNEQLCLDNIYKWFKKTSDGTLSDINFPILPEVWHSVCAESGICSGKTCGNVEDTECFYQKAKYKLANSDLIIINHHLFFSLFEAFKDLKNEGYLYKDDFIIIDEAHTLESIAAEHIVPSISREMIKYQLLRLYNDRKKRGFLLSFPSLHILPIVQNLLDINQQFFFEIRKELFITGTSSEKKLTVRVSDKNFIKNYLKSEIENLINGLRSLRKYCKSDIEENELVNYTIKFGEFNLLVDNFISQKNDTKEFVYWVELSSRKENPNVTLCTAPLDLSDYFRKNIFRKNATSILTSATLTINNNFEYFKNRFGAEMVEEIQLPAQFDFHRQVKIYIPKEIPVPQNNNSIEYNHKLAEWIRYFVKMTNGKALVLFTNSILLKAIAKELRNLLIDEKIEILAQGEGDSRKNLLDKFKKDVNSVLLGLDSFWLGVDVPGDALSNLILTRLPFKVPDHPLEQARMEYIKLKGGNSFLDYSLPEAILKFRQGTGRLIRNKTDTGIIVILDIRIINKFYGKFFLNSIDECPIEIIQKKQF